MQGPRDLPRASDLRDDGADLVAQVASKARDAAYVAVGLGVLGLQRAQARRHAAARRGVGADRSLAGLRSGLEAGGHELGELLESTVRFVEAQWEPLERQLPLQARELAGKARAQLVTLGAQLRQVVAPGD